MSHGHGLPDGFARRPFTVREAQRAGLGRGRLSGSDLVAPTSGVRSVVGVRTVPQRAWAFSLVLPHDCAFSHVTAARLWELPVPRELEDDSRPLDVMRAAGRTRIRRAGCRGREGLGRRAVTSVRGVRVTDLPDTWVDLAGGLVGAVPLSLDDLVVIGDHVAQRLGSIEPLRAAVDRRGRLRGRAALTDALALVRVGSRSPMETRARLMFVRGGLPEPELNADVTDELGEFVECCDFLWRRERVIGEYQGEHHASLTARAADNRRRLLAEDLGWRYLEIYADDVYHAGKRADCLRRFAGALAVPPEVLTLG